MKFSSSFDDYISVSELSEIIQKIIQKKMIVDFLRKKLLKKAFKKMAFNGLIITMVGTKYPDKTI